MDHPLFQLLLQKEPSNKPSRYLQFLEKEWLLLLPPIEMMPGVDSMLFTKEFVESHIIKPINGQFESLFGDKIEAKFGTFTLKSTQVHVLDFSIVVNNDNFILTVSVDGPIVNFRNALEVITLDQLLSKVDNGPGVSRKISERITLFNDIAAELDVPKLQVDVQKLLADAHLLVSSLDETQVFEQMKEFLIPSWDSLYILIEKYVIFNVYDMVFFKICQTQKEKDQALFDVISKCQDAVIGVAVNADQKKASTVFQKLATLRSPLEKIACFSDTLSILTEENISSDDLLPLIILTVLKSQIINLASNLQFIIDFSFEKDVLSGKAGYILSTFEAVISYLLENQEYLQENSIFHSTFKLELKSGSVDRVKEFLSKKSKPKFVDDKLVYFCDEIGNNAMAISLEFPPLVKYFSSIGYSVNHTNFLGETCLHLAAAQNRIAIIPDLLGLGAEIDLKTKAGHTPFSLAISKGNLEIATLLKKAGNLPLYKQLPKNSILLFADCADTLRYLFELGFSPDSVVKGKPLILYFCLQKRYDICKFMLQSTGLDIFARDDNNCGILHYCAMIPNLFPVAELLLELHSKFPINSCDLFGNTAFHLAVKSNNMKLVDLLLKKGAKPNILNNNERSSLDYATLPEIKSKVLKHLINTQLKMTSVAVLVSYLKSDSVAEHLFELKSARALDSDDDVVIVRRSLQDFRFFRAMLVKEHPESFICDIGDLVDLKIADNFLPSHRFISKMCRRLELMLRKLLESKKFENHELIWEFLQAQEFDHPSVQARVVMKTAFLEEMHADSFSHQIVDLPSSLLHWKKLLQDMETTIGLEKRCGTLSRKLLASSGLYSKELAYAGYQFSFAMGIEYKVSTGFRRLFEIMKGEHGEFFKRFSSLLQEQDDLLLGGMTAISYLLTLAEEYQAIQQHLDLLTAEVDKKSALAKTHLTPEILKEVDKAFASFSRLTHNLESCGAKLNFVMDSLNADYEALKNEHTKKLEDLIDAYVDQNLKSGDEVVSVLTEMLKI